MSNSNILIIYTGGTIGSFADPVTGQLKPVNFEKLIDFIPEINQVGATITVQTLNEPKDSSNMKPNDWISIVKLIEKNYDQYDGFVVLHGTDTMAYSASAVSFLIENLKKPVIFTGSQIPLGLVRTDAKENIISALEIATAKNKNGEARVPEVSIYFEYKLYRANRTFKFSTSHFNAYMSPNYSLLAEAGVNIEYMDHAIMPLSKNKTTFYDQLDPRVAIIKIFPGISFELMDAVSNTQGIRAIVIETFGAGNAALDPWLEKWLESAMKKNILIINVTQCIQGTVEQGKYETGAIFKKMNVISGADMTPEAALTKIMFLLGTSNDLLHIRKEFEKSLRGEITV